MILRSHYIFVLLVGFVLLSGGASVAAKAQTVEQQRLISVLTLNLARFTDWPEQAMMAEQGTINLCVMGDNIVQQSFETVDRSLVNSKHLQVVNLSRLRNLEQCQILYISALERNKLAQLLLELEDMPMLTVGENVDFVKSGGMVGFENIDGRIQLNINLNAVKRAGLVISSRILKLARIVD